MRVLNINFARMTVWRAILFVIWIVPRSQAQAPGFAQDSGKSLMDAQNTKAVLREKLQNGPVLNFAIESATVEEAFVRLLSAANVPGGLILRSDSHPISFDFDVKEMHLAQALDYLIKYDARYARTVDHEAVLLYPRQSYPKLLETRIDHFRAGPSSADGLVTLLEGSPAVTAAKASLKRRPGMFLGGLYNPNPPQISVELQNVTFAEALDAIVAKQGRAIWQYGEDIRTGEYYLRFVNH